MFRQIRFQTGEIREIIDEMKKGNIPCMDVDDIDEFMWFAGELAKYGINLAKEYPFDKKARDPVKEPEFEFRAAFRNESDNSNLLNGSGLLFIDVYFEPYIEETYDQIFGD